MKYTINQKTVEKPFSSTDLARGMEGGREGGLHVN